MADVGKLAILGAVFTALPMKRDDLGVVSRQGGMCKNRGCFCQFAYVSARLPRLLEVLAIPALHDLPGDANRMHDRDVVVPQDGQEPVLRKR